MFLLEASSCSHDDCVMTHIICGSDGKAWLYPDGSDGKVSAYNAGRPRFNPWVKTPWRREWQPTPVLLPGKSHGWRSLVGYSPWGRKESDMTERLKFHFQAQWKSGMKGKGENHDKV